MRLELSEGLTGTGGSPSKGAHSLAWQVSAGCWQESLVPHPIHLLLCCSSTLITWQVPSTKSKWSRREKGRSSAFASMLLWSSLGCHTPSFLQLHSSTLLSAGGNYTGCEYQEARLIGGHLGSCLPCGAFIHPFPSLHRRVVSGELSPWHFWPKPENPEDTTMLKNTLRRRERFKKLSLCMSCICRCLQEIRAGCWLHLL